eukprot:754145-Hanusia_phi.AAC.1
MRKLLFALLFLLFFVAPSPFCCALGGAAIEEVALRKFLPTNCCSESLLGSSSFSHIFIDNKAFSSALAARALPSSSPDEDHHDVWEHETSSRHFRSYGQVTQRLRGGRGLGDLAKTPILSTIQKLNVFGKNHEDCWDCDGEGCILFDEHVYDERVMKTLEFMEAHDDRSSTELVQKLKNEVAPVSKGLRIFTDCFRPGDASSKHEGWVHVMLKAAERGYDGTVRELVNLGLSVNSQGRHGQTPLHVAAAFGRLTVLNSLCDLGADVNAVDMLGWTPLHQASFFGQATACFLLVERWDAQVDKVNAQDQTAADLADLTFYKPTDFANPTDQQGFDELPSADRACQFDRNYSEVSEEQNGQQVETFDIAGYLRGFLPIDIQERSQLDTQRNASLPRLLRKMSRFAKKAKKLAEEERKRKQAGDKPEAASMGVDLFGSRRADSMSGSPMPFSLQEMTERSKLAWDSRAELTREDEERQRSVSMDMFGKSEVSFPIDSEEMSALRRTLGYDRMKDSINDEPGSTTMYDDLQDRSWDLDQLEQQREAEGRGGEEELVSHDWNNPASNLDSNLTTEQPSFLPQHEPKTEDISQQQAGQQEVETGQQEEKGGSLPEANNGSGASSPARGETSEGKTEEEGGTKMCGVGITLNMNSQGLYYVKSLAAGGSAEKDGSVSPGDILTEVILLSSPHFLPLPFLIPPSFPLPSYPLISPLLLLLLLLLFFSPLIPPSPPPPVFLPFFPPPPPPLICISPSHQVDNKQLGGATYADLVAMILGPPGSSVRFSLRRC